MLRTAFFILLFFISLTVPAQQIISNQQIFKVEDGLPQSFVSGILQDKDGFISRKVQILFCPSFFIFATLKT